MGEGGCQGEAGHLLKSWPGQEAGEKRAVLGLASREFSGPGSPVLEAILKKRRLWALLELLSAAKRGTAEKWIGSVHRQSPGYSQSQAVIPRCLP